MIKKIICLGVALVMILSLMACQDFVLSRYKTAANKRLETYVVEKDYSPENWEMVSGHIEAGKIAVDAAMGKADVDTAVITAKNEINAILTKEQEMSDFLLTISVDKTILQKNENFYVNVTLKNQSGEGQEIWFAYGFIPHIPGYYDFFNRRNDDYSAEDTPMPRSIFLDNNEVLRNLHMGGAVSPEGILITNRMKSGTHEMQFHFQLRGVRIWSNKIILTVK